jgi:hypothetical protein
MVAVAQEMPLGRFCAARLNVPTKTPAKGKKSASKDSAPKKSAKTKAAPPVEEQAKLDDDDDDEAPSAPAPAKRPQPKGKAPDVEAPPVVPARRLTPEAKARVNEMVKKGVPLGEALRAAASWETFVAPVKEEPAKLVQGKSFDSPRPAPRPVEDDEDEEPAASDGDDD